jgi:hypothetical protein
VRSEESVLTYPSSPGKRISLPVRVEPKVFFANERTFLSWLNFAVILGGLAIGLLNFGDKVGQISAGLFTLVAMAAMIYALGVFHWRANRIRNKGGVGVGQGATGWGGFDDRFGPTVLTVALAAVVIVNFVLRVVIGESHNGSDARHGDLKMQ